MQQQNNSQFQARINYQIRAPQVRLIDSNGDNLGVVSLQEALAKAKSQDLDLIEINHKAIPPVCKIANVGQVKYDLKKQAKAAKKNQKAQELKEIPLRPSIAENDLNNKINQAKEFLADGSKTRFVLKFKGREIQHPEIGRQRFDTILQELNGLIVENPQIVFEGNIMSVIVSPNKQK